MHYLKKRTKYLGLISAALLLPRVALAADVNDTFTMGSDFTDLVSRYYNFVIGLAIIAAILMMIIGGYFMVISAGNAALIQKGKQFITNALFGLALAILSAVLLNILNPRILNSAAGTSVSGNSSQASVQQATQERSQ